MSVESPDSVEMRSPVNPDRPMPLEVADSRAKLADYLRENHPGEWAIISQGHISRGSARQVRDRIRGRRHFEGFTWAVRRDPQDDTKHIIYAKAPGGQAETARVEVQIVPYDEVAPTF